METIRLEFTKRFLREFDSVKKYNERMRKKISQFIKEICKDPLRGTGKIERLTETRFSHRVDQKNRLIYDFFPETHTIRILCCLGHYDDR
ncbi:MAG: type II toxin-antitoxin system YoeB family toxin [Puniceicoccales bacterium]|jgi:Txe/YoeB family toxin of toxin-antitoxin system|nr:type II toxin-antitoxin system YoeB family toxin [Puniceicoccales bacterium]